MTWVVTGPPDGPRPVESRREIGMRLGTVAVAAPPHAGQVAVRSHEPTIPESISDFTYPPASISLLS
jgi:hypothetical protein